MRRLACLLAAALALAACSRAEPAPPSPLQSCPPAASGTPVDATLLAFLSKARSAHHMADEREAAKDLAGAVDVLRKVVTGPVPGGNKPRPEAAEVLADTHARLADLESQLGHFDDAAKDVGDGLELAQGDSYFRGHLFEVRGLVDQREGNALADKGDQKGAEAAKQRALDAFERAMTIQNEVIQNAVPDGGGG